MATILIVDDEPSIRLFYSDVLSEDAHVVLEASSSAEALRLISTESLDLIILDIRLRSESGLDLLQEVAQHHPHIPVMLLTAYASFQNECVAGLADSYVLKSADPGEFLEEVRRLLGHHKELAVCCRHSAAPERGEYAESKSHPVRVV